jgi:hypothetical protein
VFRIFEINFSAKCEVYIFGGEIQKLEASVIAVKNCQGAGSNNIQERVRAGQLSVYELHFTNNAGTLQRFGKRDFSTQNPVFQNL